MYWSSSAVLPWRAKSKSLPASARASGGSCEADGGLEVEVVWGGGGWGGACSDSCRRPIVAVSRSTLLFGDRMQEDSREGRRGGEKCISPRQAHAHAIPKKLLMSSQMPTFTRDYPTVLGTFASIRTTPSAHQPLQNPQRTSSALDMACDSMNLPVPTPVYVLVPPSRLFAAHWSFFIPDSQDTTRGRRIHVTGDRLNGFRLEIIREYDASLDRSLAPDRRFPIGVVFSCSNSDFEEPVNKPELIQKDDDEGGGYVDNRATDEFERICMEVNAPGPSLNSVASAQPGRPAGGRPNVAVMDCQWWVRQVVHLLCSSGILLALPDSHGTERGSPTTLVASLPVH